MGLKFWTYKGITVFPARSNGSGIRWNANAGVGLTLKADTKQGMKDLINEHLNQRGKS